MAIKIGKGGTVYNDKNPIQVVARVVRESNQKYNRGRPRHLHRVTSIAKIKKRLARTQRGFYARLGTRQEKSEFGQKAFDMIAGEGAGNG